MTKMPFDSEEENITDQWTTGRLIDELFMNMDNSFETFEGEGKTVTARKYYDQSKRIIDSSKVKGNLLFIIHFSDLSEKVRNELVDYYNDAGEIGFTILLKRAIRRIFENIDPKYGSNSVMKNLRVKFIE
jgi:hypothetical protein